MPTITQETIITYEELHESLWKYARWKSSRDGNHGHWFLNKDDLYAEYLMVIYKCYQKYASREHMTLNELKVICKSGMRNKFHSMLTRCFQTHRMEEKNSKELDDVNNNMEIAGGVDPSTTSTEEKIFDEISSNLNSFDAEVFDALIGGNVRVGMFLDLHIRRVSFCLGNRSISINSHMIATAMCEDETKIIDSLRKIKVILQERTE